MNLKKNDEWKKQIVKKMPSMVACILCIATEHRP